MLGHPYIWIATPPMVQQAFFTRQMLPRDYDMPVGTLRSMWSLQIQANDPHARAQFRFDETLKTLPIKFYHVARNRFLDDDRTLQQQNVCDGDVVLLLYTPLTDFPWEVALREQPFPPNLADLPN